MKNIVIVASIKIKSEFRDEVYAQLVKLHKNTHTYDDGVVQYELHKEIGCENSFTFIEIWENEELLGVHEKKDYFLDFIAKLENKLENMSVQKLEKIDL
ncbi:putative quinol monooxygenase [Sulfurospirillum arcachonense]|uniref:putative quinol monooxygenase n=1 Tax=Sulfurospirillum arcachonense TaxID=57666 RepID=UPI000468CD04|nr:antibiotic biosynthesis monooxygenase [Sulfurospirillum arcachonense]